jgi:hypothetical protein
MQANGEEKTEEGFILRTQKLSDGKTGQRNSSWNYDKPQSRTSAARIAQTGAN